MVVNNTYTVKIVSPNGGEVAINTIWADNEDLVDYFLSGDELTVKTTNQLGFTLIHIETLLGEVLDIPVEVDAIDYSYSIEVYGKILSDIDDIILYYNSTNNTQDIKIVEQRWSHLYNRYLTADDKVSSPFDISLSYTNTSENFTHSINSGIVSLNMLSDYSITDVQFTITAADNSVVSIYKKVMIIDGERLGILPSSLANDLYPYDEFNRQLAGTIRSITGGYDIKLNELSTKYEPFLISGTTEEILCDSPLNTEWFDYYIEGNLLWIKVKAPLIEGYRLDLSSNVAGTTKVTFCNIYITPEDLYVKNKDYVFGNVGAEFKISLGNVIGDLTINATNNLPSFTSRFEYDRSNFSAELYITPSAVSNIEPLEIVDNVIDRSPRLVISHVKFNKDLELIVETPEVIQLDIPAKIRFSNAKGTLSIIGMAPSGNFVRSEIKYDINPYNGDVSTSEGYIYFYPTEIGTVNVRAIDETSYVDISFNVLKSDKVLLDWIAILPDDSIDNLAGNLSSTAVYTDTKLKAGDLVGNLWVEGAKYGHNRIRRIKYKVSPPDEIVGDSNAGLDWLLTLKNTTSTLRIDIRDGFILNNIGKVYDVTSYWVEDNIFETEIISDLTIDFSNAQTPLITDLNHRIAVTDIYDNSGVIIYNEGDGTETVTAKVSLEPIVYFDYIVVEEQPKIPVEKPMSCYDIKRLDPYAESGEFRIFPSVLDDTSINVICEFNKDQNGNDEIWTTIPNTSIRNLADSIGRYISDDNTILDGVINNGIRPKYYPSDDTSSESPSYLFLEFPYKIKSFSYKLRVDQPSTNSMATFKIMTDTSTVFNINGSIDNYIMNTRANTFIEYNEDIIKSDLGQIVIVPDDYTQYATTANAPLGAITPIIPTDRIVIFNTGAVTGFDAAEIFLEEIKFQSIFDPAMITTEPWEEKTSSIDIPNDFVKLSTIHKSIISNSINDIINLNEYISTNIEIPYNISKDTEEIIDINEYINLDSKFIAIISLDNIGVIELSEFINTSSDEINIISDTEDNILNINEFVSLAVEERPYMVSNTDLEVMEIALEMPNIEFERTNFIYNISLVEDNPLTIDNNYKLNIVSHENIISNIYSEIIEPISNYSLKSNIADIISTDDVLDIIDLNEFVTLYTNTTNIITQNSTNIIDLGEAINNDGNNTLNNISYIDAEVIELDTLLLFMDAYHPTVIAQVEVQIIEIDEFVNINSGRELDFTVYQDGTKALDYIDEVTVDFTSLTDIYFDTDIIEQKNRDEIVEINFTSVETIYFDTDIIEQKNRDEIVEIDFEASAEFIGGLVVFETKENEELRIQLQKDIKIPIVHGNFKINTGRNISGSNIPSQNNLKIPRIEVNESYSYGTNKNGTNVRSQENKNISIIGQDINILSTRTRVSTTKEIKVADLNELVRVGLPTIYYPDTTIKISGTSITADEPTIESTYIELNSEASTTLELSIEKDSELEINIYEDSTEIIESVTIN